VTGDVDRALKNLEETCRRVGAKVTHQRREVLRAVVETDVHPDAQTVLERAREGTPTISFDTVYRTLHFLEEHGLIRRVHTPAERARFDGDPTPHHHFICTTCGRIFDFESDKVDRIDLPRTVEELGTVTRRELRLCGVCRKCRTQRGAGEKEETDD